MLKLNLPQFGIDIRDFTQEENIGIGGYSEVYSAQYKITKKNYAAKIIKSYLFKEDDKKNIENEIKIMTTIDHPAIIKYYGYSLLDFKLNPNIIIFTELLKNGSLKNIIAKAKQSNLPKNYDNTCRQIILIGIASGMKYLHHQDIMHCDLKTNNILLDENYYPNIIDFGMAKYIHKNNEKKLCGTLPYMAPELLLGKSYSYKIDVYAFAMIMYEVICERDLYPNINFNHSLTSEFKNHVGISNKRPEFMLGIKSSHRSLIQKCWSDKINERPNFDEIYNKLIDPKYYLDNVDEKRVKEYIGIITKDDIYDSSQYDLIEKVKKLTKENENLKEQIRSLKEMNEKPLIEKGQLKKIEDETKIVKQPMKDENHTTNSRFLHLKDKKENLTNSKQSTVSSNKEVKSCDTQDSHEDEIKEKSVNHSKEEMKDNKSTLQNKDFQQHSKIIVKKDKKEEKLPALNKKKTNESITINEFNSCSLKQQQQIVNYKINSMNYLSRNQFLVNLQAFLNQIIRFVQAPDTSEFIEIQAEKQEEKLDNVNISNQINILYKTTEALYQHKLLDTPEFRGILKSFNYNVSIEIMYYSKNYQGIYNIVSSIGNVNISIFISGIKKTNNIFKGNKLISSIRMDDSVVSITDYAFKNCSSLKKVVIPSSVTSIGSGCFEGCESLKSISISSSVVIIDFSTFKNCSSLSEISLPNSIKIIRDNAFEGCSSLKKILLPPCISSIGDSAFFNCSSLESISIPSSLKSIGKNAFGKCSSLKRAFVQSSVNSVIKSAFEGNISLEQIKTTS